MVSLFICAALLVVVLVLNGWFYGKTANWLGSSEGNFRNGIIVCIK